MTTPNGEGDNGNESEDAEAQQMLSDATRTFTQDDVDRIVKQRADRLVKQQLGDADLESLKTKASKYDELEAANKSELERATEKLTAAERKAAEAEATQLKLDVALEKAPEGMSVAQVRKLARRLSGGSREEMESDAEELFGEFAPAKPSTAGDRPKERLTPVSLEGGGDGSKADEIDMDAWLRSKGGYA